MSKNKKRSLQLVLWALIGFVVSSVALYGGVNLDGVSKALQVSMIVLWCMPPGFFLHVMFAGLINAWVDDYGVAGVGAIFLSVPTFFTFNEQMYRIFAPAFDHVNIVSVFSGFGLLFGIILTFPLLEDLGAIFPATESSGPK